MKIRYFLFWLLAVFTIVACKEDDIHFEGDAVSFAVTYSEITEGVTAPQDVVLTIDNQEIQVNDGKFNKTELEEKESYLVTVYNNVENVTITDGVISLTGSGSTVPSLDWLFCYAGEKKIDKSLNVTLQQQTKQINVILNAIGEKSPSIKEVTAEITEVAGQRDILNRMYKGSSTVAVEIERGVLTGKFLGMVRVLGFVPDAAAALVFNFKYNDGTTSTTTIDLSSHVEEFNDDKTVIHVLDVKIIDVGNEAETSSYEVRANGILENKDDAEVAEEGSMKLTINWPSYNTASRIEVKADGKYFVGDLEAATDVGQTTKNGFAELPAGDKIEEIAIYVESERLVAPSSYYTYADGVITMEDCKLVYKPEHMYETYITETGVYVQTTDIKLPADFTPIGAEWALRGTYDGQGFTITNLSTNEAKDHFGLFRSNAGTIKNVVIKDSKIVTGSNCGSIAAHNSGTIVNCISYAEIEHQTGSYTGGIVGRNYEGARISRCQFHGVLKSETAGSCGGIVAHSLENTIIEYCLNTASLHFPVTGGYLGGIAGVTRGVVRGCKNTGNHVFFKGSQWTGNGGVVGRSEGGQIIACVNTGNISGLEGFGGVLGVNKGADSKVTASYSTGLLIDRGTVGLVGKVVGWFLGRNESGKVEYSYCISEGQPNTSNGVFGNGNIEGVDVQKFEEAWPEEDAAKGWGIYTEGSDPTEGFYWKDLGNSATKTYPTLFWE